MTHLRYDGRSEDRHPYTGGIGRAIAAPDISGSRPVWATFYDIRRYGGLQIFLRAMLGGASLVLSRPGEAVADHLVRLANAGVTHVSGTPTHWRRALMSASIGDFNPAYVRLSGEIADQAILDALKAAISKAGLATPMPRPKPGSDLTSMTALRVSPPPISKRRAQAYELKVVDGSLRVRSSRMALG